MTEEMVVEMVGGMVKAYGQAAEGEKLHPSFSYLNHYPSNHLDHHLFSHLSDHLDQTRERNTNSSQAANDHPNHDHLISNENFAKLFEQVAAGEVKRAVTALKSSSWEASSLLLLQAVSAHCRCLVISEFFNTFKGNNAVSPSLQHLLSLLLQLLA